MAYNLLSLEWAFPQAYCVRSVTELNSLQSDNMTGMREVSDARNATGTPD